MNCVLEVDYLSGRSYFSVGSRKYNRKGIGIQFLSRMFREPLVSNFVKKKEEEEEEEDSDVDCEVEGLENVFRNSGLEEKDGFRMDDIREVLIDKK